MPRGACPMGGQTYEPVRGPWFVNRPPIPWCSIPWCSIPWCSMPGARSPGARCPVLDARCSMPGARCPGRRFARRSVMLSTWRTFSACNRRASHCARFVKTRRTSSCSLSVIRTPWQWVSAHGARLVVACYRPMGRRSLIFARVSFSAFPVSRRACLFPVARVCHPG